MRLDKLQKLDELAQRLVRTNGLPAEEIEKIVSSPELYHQIRARIEAKQAILASTKKASLTDSIFRLINNWKSSPRLTFAAASLTVAFACAIVLIVWQAEPFDSTKTALSIENASRTQTSDFSNYDNQVLSANTQSATTTLAAENEKRVIDNTLDKTPKVIKKEFVGSRKTKNFALPKNNVITAQTQFIKPKKDVVLPPTEAREFYALAFANNLETTENKQIVRVELSPEALASLGVVTPNYAAPNSGSKSVTADLLLGEDGTPRAIRFVH